VEAVALNVSAFSHPYLLGALAALPVLSLLAVLAARRRTHGLVRMAGLVGAAVLERSRPSRLRGLCAWLGLVCLAAGMAGPRWGRDWSQSAAPGRDVVVVLDLSRSMFAESPSRARQAKKALLDLADKLALRGGHRVGLVVFAGQPRVACPLTHDLDHFRDAVELIDESNPDPTLGPGTRIGAGLVVAVQAFEGRSSRARDVILLSDGDDPAGDGEWHRGIEAARAEGVAVTCVAVGDPALDETDKNFVRCRPHFIPDGKKRLKYDGKDVVTRLEKERLREVARRTGGELLFASEKNFSLGDHYLDHAKRAGGEDSPEAVPVYRQRQGWFLLPAFVLLSLTLLLPERGGVR
jgi:Ca-activated chloride channel family protein